MLTWSNSNVSSRVATGLWSLRLVICTRMLNPEFTSVANTMWIGSRQKKLHSDDHHILD